MLPQTIQGMKQRWSQTALSTRPTSSWLLKNITSGDGGGSGGGGVVPAIDRCRNLAGGTSQWYGTTILSLLREESRVEDCAQIETDIGEGCRKARAAPPMSAKYP